MCGYRRSKWRGLIFSWTDSGGFGLMMLLLLLAQELQHAEIVFEIIVAVLK